MPWHISERGGGAEVQANYLANELAKRGYRVFYICQTINSHKINTVETLDNIEFHWLKPSGRFHWLDQNKYLKKLQIIKPNVAIQRLSSNVTYVIGNYCRKTNCKFVWICTDNISPYKDFHVRKFKKSSELKVLGFIKYYSFFLNAKIMDGLRNRGMKNVDVAFTQNESQYRNLQQEFHMLSERMISGHQIPEKTISVKNRFDSRTVIWCGNFGKNKRPEICVKLANTLKNKQIKFIMIGGHSDKAYVSEILKDKPDTLIATGQVSFEESLSYFDHAALLVNTSVLEGFSNTYIQAWLRGVPTVVFGADPNDVIRDNDLGHVAESIDSAQNFIINILDDLNNYETRSEIVKKYAMKHHTIDKMTDNFLMAANIS